MKIEYTQTPVRWMLVDDDDALRAPFGDLLAKVAGVEVASFASGMDAVKAFAAAPELFDFIVTDLDMPVMSGIDFCKRIKAIRPEIKILLATGSGIVAAKEAAGFGFCGMVSKPFTADTLRSALIAVRAGEGESRRTRLSALPANNHQPNQAGTVPVCMAA